MQDGNEPDRAAEYEQGKRESLVDRVRRAQQEDQQRRNAPMQRLTTNPARVVDADAKLKTNPAITGQQPAEPPALGPLHHPPTGLHFTPDEKRALLAGAFAGVELGAWDNRVLDWLAIADSDVVVSVVGMVRRAVADARLLGE